MILKFTTALLASVPTILVSLSGHALAQALPPFRPFIPAAPQLPPVSRIPGFSTPSMERPSPTGADGTQAKPFNNLNALAALAPGYKVPLLTNAVYDHYPSSPRIRAGGGGPIAPGDQILLDDRELMETSASIGPLSMDNAGSFSKLRRRRASIPCSRRS